MFAAALAASAQPARTKKATPAKPAAAPVAPTEFPVESVKVTGNKHFTEAQVLAVAALKLGSPANKQTFDHARDRLAATGAFLDIQMSYSAAPSNAGYAGVIHVVEASEVYLVRIEDLPVPAEKLLAHMQAVDPLFGEKIPGTKEFLARWTAELNQTVKSLAPNWNDQVEGKLTADLEVLFRPGTRRPSIAEVRFLNNSVLPTSTLQNALNAVAIGIVYTEATLRTMLDMAIKPLYDARGRIRTTFPKIEIEKHKNSDGVVPVITVDEGPSYSIAAVRLTGSDRLTKKMLDKFDIKIGDIANFDRIKEGQIRIEEELRNQGYLNAASKSERATDDQKHTVDVAVVVTTGPQFLFGKLTIKGLDLIVEPQIRKAWSLAPGRPFNPEYADKFIKYIKEEGVFENLASDTRAENEIDAKTHVVDVTLYFKGAAPEKKPKIRQPEPEPAKPPIQDFR